MKREVFRKEALERLSSPEQLDSLMPVTSSRGWVALAGIGLLLLMGLIWGIAGTVETTIAGSGLLMRHVESVPAPQAGEVAKIHVIPDKSVKRGDLLLTLIHGTSNGSPQTSEILAPIAGRVLDINVDPEDHVAAGETLATVEAPDAPLQAIVYVSPSNGFKVEPEMDVRALPVTATTQGGAFLRGRVKSVDRSPVTRAKLMRRWQNDEWADSLMRLGPVLEVVIDLPSETPLAELYSRTPCDASIILAKQRPIRFLIPSADN